MTRPWTPPRGSTSSSARPTGAAPRNRERRKRTSSSNISKRRGSNAEIRAQFLTGPTRESAWGTGTTTRRSLPSGFSCRTTRVSCNLWTSSSSSLWPRPIPKRRQQSSSECTIQWVIVIPEALRSTDKAKFCQLHYVNVVTSCCEKKSFGVCYELGLSATFCNFCEAWL